jgi:tetratricopeptide (TPR) repeat protein
MAKPSKKKQSAKGKKKKKKGSQKDALPESLFEDPAFGRGFIERVLQKLAKDDENEDTERTPLQMAQDIIYDAWEEPDFVKRCAMAQLALEISPDCADAYSLLAQETSSSLRYAIENFTKAVEAGERALGPEPFREDVGHFWGLLETRPYMRARNALAQCLWEAARDDEAIEHARELLRLNPGDNQGMRYVLIHWLIETERDDEAWDLLDAYQDDDTAPWVYSKALLLFRKEGDSKNARMALQTAMHTNEHVPDFLLGQRELPEEEPEYYSPGDEREAVMYAVSAHQSWIRTSGAIKWLKDRTS